MAVNDNNPYTKIYQKYFLGKLSYKLVNPKANKHSSSTILVYSQTTFIFYIMNFCRNIKEKRQSGNALSGKFTTPCNKASTKIYCLNQQLSKVEIKIYLTVSELVNVVSALIYLWIFYLWSSTCCHYIYSL